MELLKSNLIRKLWLLELIQHDLGRSLQALLVFVPAIYPYPLYDAVFVCNRFGALEVWNAAIHLGDLQLVYALAVAQRIEAGHDLLRIFLSLE